MSALGCMERPTDRHARGAPAYYHSTCTQIVLAGVVTVWAQRSAAERTAVSWTRITYDSPNLPPCTPLFQTCSFSLWFSSRPRSFYPLQCLRSASGSSPPMHPTFKLAHVAVWPRRLGWILRVVSRTSPIRAR